MKSNAAHQAIHQKGGARHVACVFEQANEEEQETNLRQENQNGAYAGDDAIDQQALQRSSREQMRNQLAEQVHALADLVHRPASKGEDALEHQGHDRQKNEHTPNAVSENAVEFVAEGVRCLARFDRDLLLNFGQASITGFDGHTAPIDS